MLPWVPEKYTLPSDKGVSVLSSPEPQDALETVPPPTSDPRPEHAASLLAKEMTRLSVQERENALYDLHGICSSVEETPEFVESKFAQLDQELAKICSKPSYDLALSQSPEYVTNRDFRLMFLRCDRWDARLTAIRMGRYFSSKLDLFGEEKLTKTITQADLSSGDLECLYSGYFQQLPFRDRAGRLVYFINPGIAPDRSVQHKVGLRAWKICLIFFSPVLC
jgi:hypothetical protein